MTPANLPTTLHLHFEPNRDLVAIVRRFVAEFYDRVLGNDDATGRIALATHELLENAVKYASTMATTISIDVQEDKGPVDRTVLITTVNRATPDEVAGLKSRFEAIAASTDPFEFYQKMIRESALRHTGSGLGLARIMAEADMKLAMEVHGDDVHILARTTIRQGAES